MGKLKITHIKDGSVLYDSDVDNFEFKGAVGEYGITFISSNIVPAVFHTPAEYAALIANDERDKWRFDDEILPTDIDDFETDDNESEETI